MIVISRRDFLAAAVPLRGVFPNSRCRGEAAATTVFDEDAKGSDPACRRFREAVVQGVEEFGRSD